MINTLIKFASSINPYDILLVLIYTLLFFRLHLFFIENDPAYKNQLRASVLNKLRKMKEHGFCLFYLTPEEYKFCYNALAKDKVSIEEVKGFYENV